MQDLPVEIAFPVIQNAEVTLLTLPRNGTLYQQELLGTEGQRVQVVCVCMCVCVMFLRMRVCVWKSRTFRDDFDCYYYFKWFFNILTVGCNVLTLQYSLFCVFVCAHMVCVLHCYAGRRDCDSAFRNEPIQHNLLQTISQESEHYQDTPFRIWIQHPAGGISRQLSLIICKMLGQVNTRNTHTHPYYSIWHKNIQTYMLIHIQSMCKYLHVLYTRARMHVCRCMHVCKCRYINVLIIWVYRYICI